VLLMDVAIPSVDGTAPKVDAIERILMAAGDLRTVGFDLLPDKARGLGVRTRRKFFIVRQGMRRVPQRGGGGIVTILEHARPRSLESEFGAPQRRPINRYSFTGLPAGGEHRQHRAQTEPPHRT